ncbi:MAG: hypothetical protein A3J08_01010 [Candidatus Lloydbacteria bacterium RIFCSPLOWO2_02_FULL_51_11]|uniref:Uncharacterized protein n=1 Tax=Candidatus Lloydbacteria bacterium RIFCSPLOWO2_02_FULL_51_11 TaxID=1798667 RepID=A0A1G2DMB7_9BACT|nr:MAG: hypothetical protein A3J08_01010 [Candidatus Lloydbacteria bacterium RIFCSPLOWO2_02_FULL_51_11]
MLTHYVQKGLNVLIFVVGIYLFLLYSRTEFKFLTMEMGLCTLLGMALMWASVVVLKNPCARHRPNTRSSFPTPPN